MSQSLFFNCQKLIFSPYLIVSHWQSQPKLVLVNPSQGNRENFAKPKSLSVFSLYYKHRKKITVRFIVRHWQSWE